MNSVIIELSVSPPMERPNIQGLVARLTISRTELGEQASICARRFYTPAWLEFEPGSELKDVEALAVNSRRAKAVLDRMANTKVSPISSSKLGIHPTTYRVRIVKGATSSEFSWWDEVPIEWLSLADVVAEIQSISEEALGAP